MRQVFVITTGVYSQELIRLLIGGKECTHTHTISTPSVTRDHSKLRTSRTPNVNYKRAQNLRRCEATVRAFKLPFGFGGDIV